jgi:drug/metabolite transporter superfamily protein YnfA
MWALLRTLLILVVILALLLLGAWGTLALWYRLPAPEWVRIAAAAVFAVFSLWAVLRQFRPARLRALATFGVVFAALLVWWTSIEPPRTADWQPEVARQVTGEINGDLLTLTDVRDFDWRTPQDFTQSWVTRSYDLSKVETVDLFMSYWAGAEMAHMMVSFGFSDGKFLPWSVEVRRAAGGGFSPLDDMFKSHTISIIASEERDVVGLRSNIRKEDVEIFRLRMPPERARELLEAYVAKSNALAQQPEFFNSLFSNCSATVIKMASAIGDNIPFDWRLIVNGYFPNYLYDHGALSTSVSLQELRQLGKIDARAIAHGLQPGYSEAIRVGVPTP